MGLVRTVPPDSDVIGVEEMKVHLREEGTEQDALITSLTAAAVDLAEVRTSKALANQTWQLTLDRFPCDSQAIQIPRPPLQSISTITYLDRDGVQQTLASSKYRVDATGLPGRVTLEFDQSWPETRDVSNAVTVTFVAGFGADVPETLKAAIRLMVGHWYEHREAVITGTIATELPMAVESLLWANRYLEA